MYFLRRRNPSNDDDKDRPPAAPPSADVTPVTANASNAPPSAEPKSPSSIQRTATETLSTISNLPTTNAYRIIHLADIRTKYSKRKNVIPAKTYVVVSLDKTYTTRTNPFDRYQRRKARPSLDIPFRTRPTATASEKHQHTSSSRSASRRRHGEDGCRNLRFEVYETDTLERDRFVGSQTVEVFPDKLQVNLPKRLYVPIHAASSEKVGTVECTMSILDVNWSSFHLHPQVTSSYLYSMVRRFIRGSALRELVALLFVPLLVFISCVAVFLLVFKLMGPVANARDALYFGFGMCTLVMWPAWPAWFGALAARVVKVLYLGDTFYLAFGPMHLKLWMTENHRVHVLMICQDMVLGNPPGFPFRDLVSCGKLSVQFSLKPKHIVNILLGRKKHTPLRHDRTFQCAACIQVDHVELEDVILDCQMFNGKLNLVEFVDQWAKEQVLHGIRHPKSTGLKPLPPPDLYSEKRLPNTLDVQVLSCEKLGLTSIPGLYDDTSEAAAVGDPDNDDASTCSGSSRRSLFSTHSAPPYVLRTSSSSKPSSRTHSMLRNNANTKPFDYRRHRPYVVVQARNESEKTRSVSGTLSPVWSNEVLELDVASPSTMLHVVVRNKVDGSMYGQWVIMVKNLIANPANCRHNGPLTREEGGWISGRFPLVSESWRQINGEVHLRLRWRHKRPAAEESITGTIARALTSPFAKPPSAYNQLKMFLQESTLITYNMGEVDVTDVADDPFPYLFNVHRVTVRRFRGYVKDLLRGHRGQLEDLKRRGVSFDRADALKIDSVEWTKEFQPKHHTDPGITWDNFLSQLINVVMKKAVLKGGGVKQTAEGLAYQVADTLGLNFAASLVSETKHGLHRVESMVVNAATRTIPNAFSSLQHKITHPLDSHDENKVSSGGRASHVDRFHVNHSEPVRRRHEEKRGSFAIP